MLKVLSFESLCLMLLMVFYHLRNWYKGEYRFLWAFAAPFFLAMKFASTTFPSGLERERERRGVVCTESGPWSWSWPFLLPLLLTT